LLSTSAEAEVSINAQGAPSSRVKPHPLYQALGPSEAQALRAEAYRELFRFQLEPGLVDQIHAATNGNVALGSQRFADEVEAA
jgi:putative transposase